LEERREGKKKKPRPCSERKGLVKREFLEGAAYKKIGRRKKSDSNRLPAEGRIVRMEKIPGTTGRERKVL